VAVKCLAQNSFQLFWSFTDGMGVSLSNIHLVCAYGITVDALFLAVSTF